MAKQLWEMKKRNTDRAQEQFRRRGREKQINEKEVSEMNRLPRQCFWKAGL